MNEQLIKAKHQAFIYELKEGTASSYYLVEGRKNIVPERLSFSKNDLVKIDQRGRTKTEIKVGQIAGNFKQKDESIYKQHRPYAFFSSIWQACGHPLFVGYGDVGISNASGIISTTKDLFVIYQPYKGRFEFHLFAGLKEFKEEVLSYLQGTILNRTKAQEWASELDINELRLH